ncbi:MAG: hypothetical protein KGN16_00235 [Burkholderiales bacterium]|nr:hypothetical protein [Burkholderiales bacterium]
MQLRNTLTAAIVGVGLLAASAQAAIVSGTYSFAASGFSNGFPNFSGSFTVSFDNAGSIIDSTALTVNTLSPNRFGTIGFSYGAAPDILTFGGAADSGGVLGLAGLGYFSQTGLEDFYFAIDLASSATPTLRDLVVTNQGIAGRARTVDFLFTPAPATAVPVPPTLTLSLLGILCLGVARRWTSVPSR